MFVVIVCANCGGSSQVAEGALGQTVQCPLCDKPTLARTPQAVLPIAKPVQDAPLSLDDAPPAPSAKIDVSLSLAKKSPVRTAVYATLSLLATLVLMAGIYGAFNYGTGGIPDSAWKTFVPPQGHCSISLPGDPTEEPVPAEGHAVLGGKRFIVNRWFERVRVGFGWIDLDAERLKGVQFDQIADPFRDREMKRLNAKLEGESVVNFVSGKRKFEAMRYQFDTDGVKIILQIYLEADVDRRRLYFAAVAGKKVRPDLAWVQRFFNSFAPE